MNILTEENIALPLSKLATTYARQHAVSVNVTATSPEQMQEQIRNGEPADIVISAYPPLFQDLAQQGLSDDSSRQPLAQEKLALLGGEPAQMIALPEGEKQGVALKEWLESTPRWQLAPNTSQGYWAAEWDKQNAVEMPTNHAPTLSVLQEKLNTITPGQPFAIGVGFASDTLQNPGLKSLQALALPVSVEYQAVVVAGEQMPAARELMAFLNAPAQKAALQQWLTRATVTP